MAAAPALLAPGIAAAQAQPYGDHPHYWGGGWGWGHMIFGPLMMIVFVAVIVVIAVLAVRWLGGGPARPGSPAERKAALDILAERYARGEIDREEYQRKKQDLG
jgi:putative membrane protein